MGISWERLPRGGSKRKFWQGIGPDGAYITLKPVRRPCSTTTIGWNLNAPGILPEARRFGSVIEAKAFAETLFPPGYRRSTWPDLPWAAGQKTA